MKIGMTYYNVGGLSFEEVLAFAQKTGFDYIQIGTSHLWNLERNLSQGDMRAQKEELAAWPIAHIDEAVGLARKAKALLDKYNLKVSAFTAASDFIQPSDAEVRFQVERMEHITHLLKELDCTIICTDGGWAKDSVPKERWFDLAVQGLSACAPFVEKQGMTMALDNHGIIFNDADFQIKIFEKVGSKALGANMDTMNYRWAGHDIPTINRYYDIIAPYTLHTHLKDGFDSFPNYRGMALGEGEIDLMHAIRALKKAGYDGVWTNEYEGKTDPEEGYRKGYQYIKEHVPEA